MAQLNREEILEAVDTIKNHLQEANQVLEVAAPVLLPELQKFLDQCSPLADMISEYFMGPKFKAAITANVASQLALKLVENGDTDVESVSKKSVQMALRIQELSKQAFES